ncbi:MAG: hypothetical protein HUU38_02935 [Anaerolineales bacterium]|nr:hypothetical protein [Anaerolineales bacterium]
MAKHKIIPIVLLLLLLLFPVAISRSSFTNRKYENAELGITLEIPGNWDLEVTERVLGLYLKPWNIDETKSSVSITIWAGGSTETNLLIALANDIKRLKRVEHIEEVVYLHPPEEYFYNNYEAASVTIQVPITSASSAQGSNPVLNRPMDIIVIRGDNHLIFVFVRKSNTEIFWNAQADSIVNSIKLVSQNE